MANTDQNVVDSVNDLALEVLRLAAERKEIKAAIEQEAAQAALKYAADISGNAAATRAANAALWQFLAEHSDTLFAKNKRSFATLVAKFQLRKVSSKTTVSDEKGALQAAREVGVVRHVAKLVHRWELKSGKLLAWLETHGEFRDVFEGYLDYTPEHDSLSITPNTANPVFHDKKRVSIVPVIIRKDEPRD